MTQDIGEQAGEHLLKAIKELAMCSGAMPDGQYKMHIQKSYSTLYAIANELKLFDIPTKPILKKVKKDE
jgi:hypothetical protein